MLGFSIHAHNNCENTTRRNGKKELKQNTFKLFFISRMVGTINKNKMHEAYVLQTFFVVFNAND